MHSMLENFEMLHKVTILNKRTAVKRQLELLGYLFHGMLFQVY